MTVAVAVVGAHGGAGAATVVGLLSAAGVDVTRVADPLDVPDAASPAVVVRSTATGMAAATQVLADWPAHKPRPWLVVVADVPAPPPPVVRYRVRELGAQARGHVSVPFLWPLRTATTPAEAADTKVVQKAAAKLRDALLPEEAVNGGP